MFLGDCDRLIANIEPPMNELNASRALQHVNVFSGQHLIGTWNPAAGKVYYAYSDWLGTKRYEADGAGTYVNSWTSLPFGDNETALGTGTDATEHHFTGKEHDAESGLDYFQARYYQSQTGRWLLPDWSETPVPVPYATFANPQSLNLYTYVGNNPVNQVDADGHVSSQNATSYPPGSVAAIHMLLCAEPDSGEPGCLEGNIDAIMDGAIPVHPSEERIAYLQQLADQKPNPPPPPPIPPIIVTVEVQGTSGGCNPSKDIACQLAYNQWRRSQESKKKAPNNGPTWSQKNKTCLNTINNTPDGKFYNFFSPLSMIPGIGPDWQGSIAEDVGGGTAKFVAFKFFQGAGANWAGTGLGVIGKTVSGAIEGVAEGVLAPVAAAATVGQLTVHAGCAISAAF